MRCCVPGCKNDSRNISKSQGITFHVFPTEPSLRLAWAKALDRVDWEPKDRSAVCSDHFLCTDLYETRRGLRKVRSGAVPIVQGMLYNEDFSQPSQTVCRICLAIDAKLYSLNKYKEAFERLTGLTLPEEDKLPQKLCMECVHRLLNCSKFRDKSLRANSLLNELVNKHGSLTPENLISIDREKNRLASNLRKKIFPTDHCDFNYEYTEDTSKSVPNITVDVQVLEIKYESEIFIDESLSELKNEFGQLDQEIGQLDQGVSQLDREDGQLDQNGDQQNESDGLDDQDFEASDKGFSSDDSIPLERKRSKKKVKQKKSKLSKSDRDKKRKVPRKKDPGEPKVDRRRKPFLNEDLNETLFTITDLTIEEQLAEILKRQESANYKNAVFKCTECFKGFLDEDAYNGHMIRHSKECGEYQCEICKTHFKQSHALRKHITAHHTQRFSCNQCPYVTTHRQTARLHERWHKGTKYECPHCRDVFTKFTTYMGHIRIKHPSDFVCQLCGFSFVSAKGIELHKKLKHRLESDQVPEDGPLCAPCNVRFVTEHALRQHVRVSARHNTADQDQRESNKPKKRRKSQDTKDREKRTRDRATDDEEKRKLYPSQMRKAEGPIPCEQCGMQLEDSRAYHGHFRRMHPDKNRTNYPSMKSPCMCEVCGRMFQSYALLKDHRWTHTGERPFACADCGKSFRMKQRLVAHSRVHAQVKSSYVCGLCGKHFSTHSNRQRHMFIHTGLKPFQCEMCGKCFKHASEKRAHITYVHLKKPWPKRSRGKRNSRQGTAPQPSLSTSGQLDGVQPLWPPCDPKLDHIAPVVDDKPLYYNLKI